MPEFNFHELNRLQPILDALQGLRPVNTRNAYHPEVNVLNHSLQCFRWACRESDDPDLIMAALLHDVGKAHATHGHEKHSVELLQGHVSDKTLWLIRNHMRIWAYLEGAMKQLQKSRQLPAHPWFADLCRLARFDKLGRNPNQQLHLDYDPRALVERLQRLSV